MPRRRALARRDRSTCCKLSPGAIEILKWVALSGRGCGCNILPRFVFQPGYPSKPLQCKGAVMTPIFPIDKRGTFRRTICIGPWALRIARNATGGRRNHFEADLWARTTARRCEMPGARATSVRPRCPHATRIAVDRRRSCAPKKNTRLSGLGRRAAGRWLSVRHGLLTEPRTQPPGHKQNSVA